MIAMHVRNGLIAGFSAALMMVGAASAAPADEQRAPEPSLNKQIGDWTVQCFQQAGASTCRMNEMLVNKKTGMRVLSVTVLYVPERKSSFIEAVVPLNVALQSGVTISADTFTSGTLQYNICVQQGCQTVLPADGNVISSLGRATKGAVEVVDYTNGKKIKIGFPLEGFNEAYQTVVSNTRAAAGAAAAPAAN
ncbi:MAG: invasion associated locus B family protein [Rhizomicrobium sp.]